MRIQGVIFCFFLVTALFAQGDRGTITGAVTDSTGAPIPNVAVSIVNTATNTTVRVTTTSTGEYTVASLPPGEYRVEIAAPGFKRFVENGVRAAAGGTVRLDAQLEVGQVSESVEVQAQVAGLQTENAKVTSSVENKAIDELPLVVGGAMRSPFDLVTIIPQARGSGNALMIGGGQAAAWGATLDGLSVNTNRSGDAGETAYLTPSVEAITEFAVETNGFKAEYGQAGGGMISFASKSGSNAFHGTAYEFLRNDDFDARGFFATQRSIYKQSDFGGSLGGPVTIPKLYRGKDRTFFFVTYEGFRNRIGSNGGTLTVPTPEMYQGDFSKWVDSKNALLPIYDTGTTRANPTGSGFVRDPFPGNQIPVNQFSAVAKQILPYAKDVAPNRPGLVPGTSAYVRNNYIVTGGTTTTPTDKYSVKLDHNIGFRQHLSFFLNRTVYDSGPGPSGTVGLPQPLWNGQVSHYEAGVYRMSYDFTITPRLLNHISVGGNTFFKNSYSPNALQNWQGKVCIKNAVDCTANFPNISFSDQTGWGSSSFNGTEQPNWSIKEDLSWVRGAHSLKFGYAFTSQRANGFGQQNIAGQATFSFLETGVPGVTNATSGSSFASFLLGNADSGATETIRYVPQTFPYHGFYAQDDWRVSKRLTLNLGLRYEFTLPPVAGGDQYEDFSPTTPNPAVNNYPGALIFAGSGAGRQGTRSLVPGWYGGIGPRVGAAYSVNSKTTIRSGFARSFSRVTVVASSSHYSGFIGQYSFASTNQGITPAFNWDAGLPSYPLPPQIDPAFSNNQNTDYWQGQNATRAPESYNWTFSIQREIARNTTLEANYNATSGAHLQAGIVNINQVPMSIVNNLIAKYGPTQAISLLNSNITSPAAVAAGIPIPYPNFTNSVVQRSMTVNQALRPFPQYLTIDTSQSGGDKSGHSTYHAMVIRLDHRFGGGLTLQWNYALAKLLTDADTYYANTGFAQDQGNRRLEKSIGQYDQTHVLKFNTIYDLPFGKGRRWVTHGFANWVAGGWRLGAIQVYSTGLPLGVTRNNPLPIFNGSTRPVITSYDDWLTPVNGSFDPKQPYLNIAAFPAQPTYLMGNETRLNPKARGFANKNENVSLGKSFPMTERFRLDFRAEAFNLLNRTIFGNPNTSLNSNSFGLVTSQANSPRQMQLALKLYW
ncbi:MAG TPA: carboxypeptidase regulatory-like domain-containing protein [Candidatus Acidoferrales bacterium]|nr:carboxypeptidase regulatory-like domain-containing protein [Candidatus Acidoferrales bacterium]